MGTMIDLHVSDGAVIKAYHAQAQGARKGGLIVIQEIFGVTDHIKEVADSYAADGYEVIAPSLFDRQAPLFEATYSEEDVKKSIALAGQNPPDERMADLQAAMDMLKGKGPVFMTGYCYGGSLCWVAACRLDGLAAVSGYYGRLAPEYADETPKCPVIMHFGEHDHAIPMDRVQHLQDAHPDVPVYVYDAGHGFNSDRRADYDEACAALARKRTLELFAANS
ncbi:MAG: dienelactone hydrolase family protein [Alphaproteobacteria bacterium]|nr:MAG: dienelactone hydrolase family protein [Alphaproteobacteria bacterium]